MLIRCNSCKNGDNISCSGCYIHDILCQEYISKSWFEESEMPSKLGQIVIACSIIKETKQKALEYARHEILEKKNRNFKNASCNYSKQICKKYPLCPYKHDEKDTKNFWIGMLLSEAKS